MKKQIFYSLFCIFSLVMTGAFITSCNDDDDDGGGKTELSITSIDPATARVGDTIVINGSGFSTDRTLNGVQFAKQGSTLKVDAEVTAATITRLNVEVPELADSGTLTVTVGEKTATSSQNFTIDTSLGEPKLTSIDPTNGYAGSTVTIIGENFGSDASVVKVYFNDSEATEITTVTNTSIQTTVPLGLEVGETTVKVVRESVESTNTLTYTVNKTPTKVKTVYWTSQSYGIYRGVITSTGADIVPLYNDADPYGIEVDTDAGYIYWASYGSGNGKILKAPVNGEGDIETLYEGIGLVVDIAIDQSLQKIFIMAANDNPEQGYIYSANLDGSSTEMQILYTPSYESYNYAVKLLVSQNKIYWTNAMSKQVMEGSVNGSSEAAATVLFDESDGLKGPHGLAIDETNNKIYVVDNGQITGTGTSNIYSGNLNGEGTLSVLVESGDNVYSPADAEIDLDNGYFFWLNNAMGMGDCEVMRAKLDGSEVEQLFGGINNGMFFDLDIQPSTE